MNDASRIRRTLADVALSVAGLTIIVGALIAFDSRLREQVLSQINGEATGTGVVGVGSRLVDVAKMFIQVGVDQSGTHPSLTVFAVASIVLVVFMLRT